MFDILCRQEQDHKSKRGGNKSLRLDFPVEDFYALGSPIGLFQMLGGRTIAARQTSVSPSSRVESDSGSMEDPMFAVPSKKAVAPTPGHVQGENPVSRPKCAQIFNVCNGYLSFLSHPADFRRSSTQQIRYRIASNLLYRLRWHP